MLAVLRADAAGALGPARLVQELLGLGWVVSEQVAVVGGAGHVALDEGRRQLPVWRVDGVDDLLPIDAGLEGLTHLHVVIRRQLGVDRKAVYEAEVARRRDGEPCLLKGLQL